MGKRSRRRQREQRQGEQERRQQRAGRGPTASTRPGGGRPGERVLAKVRALLAKAESTSFEAEAEALTAKAQELMARYSLTQAMLEADGSGRADPMRRDLDLEAPYVGAKAFLLGAVASANRCRVIWGSHPPRAAVFGYPDDLEAVELLYTSLLLQVAGAIAAQGSVRDVTGTSRTRSFRRSFLLGFAARIGERLHEATEATAEDLEAETGSSLLPVLARRAERVDALAEAAFPHVVSRRFRASNGGGYLAGREAGDRASITTQTSVRSRGGRGLTAG